MSLAIKKRGSHRVKYVLAACLGILVMDGLQGQTTNLKAKNINYSASSRSAIFTGAGNLIRSNSAASLIGGGFSNQVTGDWASVLSGGYNTVSGFAATVVGGNRNSAIGTDAMVGGGHNNHASSDYATVSGGYQNMASGFISYAGGGYSNQAIGDYSAVGGGQWNQALGAHSTIPGGANGLAAHPGSFVWGDGSTTTESWGAYTFTIRASGGARIYSTSDTNTGVVLAAGSGTWASMSDRNAKENFDRVNALGILAKVAAMPVMTWNYKTQGKDIRHIGPVAQDFKEAFGVGESDIAITTVDADGVALAAIQGLVEELKIRDKKIDAMGRQLDELKSKIDSLAPPGSK